MITLPHVFVRIPVDSALQGLHTHRVKKRLNLLSACGRCEMLSVWDKGGYQPSGGVQLASSSSG